MDTMVKISVEKAFEGSSRRSLLLWNDELTILWLKVQYW